MKTVTKSLKPERIQGQSEPITPERLLEERDQIGDWTVDRTPNAIYRHFPQPSFSASAAFVARIAEAADKHGRSPHVVINATGVTVWLGNPPNSGVTEADLEMAAGVLAVA